MGKGAEALVLEGLGILGLGVSTGINLSADKIPVTTNPDECALIMLDDAVALRSSPSNIDGSVKGRLNKDDRLPYVGSVHRVKGSNVDPNRSDGADWLMAKTIDGRLVYVSALYGRDSCPDRQAQR